MAHFPTTSFEPYPLRTVGATTGTMPAATRSIAATHVSEPAGSGGDEINLVLKNKGAAFAVSSLVQVQTSDDDFTGVTSPSSLSFEMNGVAAEGIYSAVFTLPVGVKWRVKNNTANAIEAEYFVRPNR
jgi:hypothetical protein